MSWLEIIHLRVTSADIETVIPLAKDLVKQAEEERSCCKAGVFRRVFVDTDMSVFLYHDQERSHEGEGSSLGTCIASALRDFGMVHHVSWLEL